jgi:hypothetical protein
MLHSAIDAKDCSARLQLSKYSVLFVVLSYMEVKCEAFHLRVQA